MKWRERIGFPARVQPLKVRVKDPAQVLNPDLVEGAKNQVRVRDPRHKSVTRSSHLQVRVKHPAQVLNPDLAKSG